MKFCLVALAGLVAVAVANPASSGALNDRVNKFQRIRIHPDQVTTPSRYTRDLTPKTRSFSLNIPVYDEELTLIVQPNTELFSDRVQIIEVHEEGERPYSLDHLSFYRGYVAQYPDASHLHLRVDKNGSCFAQIITPTEMYAVEPAAWHFDNAQHDEHVVYRLSDHVNPVSPNHSSCKVMTFDGPEDPEAAKPVPFFRNNTTTRHRRDPFDNSRTACDVAVIADRNFYTSSSDGDSDIGRTVELLVSSFSNVQQLYEDNNIEADGVFVGIKIGRIEVITSSSDQRFVLDTTSGEDFLHNFAGENWEDYCLAHLVTHQEFSDGLLGLAYLGRADSTPGGICQKKSSNVYTNTAFSTTLNYGSAVPELTHWLVIAHEIGHNFGSTHDDPSGSANGEYLMYPVSVDGSESNNFLFSPESKSLMTAVVEAKGGCFVDSDASICGNLVQEGDEECDCGTASGCPAADECCNVFSQGSADNCNLRAGKQCSPFHTVNGACCKSDCSFQNDGFVCREESQCVREATCTTGECPAADYYVESTYCSASYKDKMCSETGSGDTTRCTLSICDAFGLEEGFFSTENQCKVSCVEDGEVKLLENVNAALAYNPTLRSGSSDAGFSKQSLDRSPGSKCNYVGDNGDVRIGVCTTEGNCESAEGGRTAFDDVEKFLRNLSVDDILNWALRTDAYIPNYGWLLIGLGVLALLIGLLCHCSNKKDSGRGIKG
ncbi:uncharacterized protein MONBRDRAFT_31368 [Monosiga brevicollis MX1]|uniref:Peptidase M12B domain-containing protein n=1 Tax=Monosiga brevicollis TaxID=81824 RepID=A9URI9_MONBE|nr:uncharacterized protein MONBRDRAFT_31368 [Monosiga brevicollis MX1]EDQ91931.1 predicted protein [Monosiga brevicollis MX1]|eukprot:XP_001743217.1 hypothetical protein [Monosiga brevicollis MX1]